MPAAAGGAGLVPAGGAGLVPRAAAERWFPSETIYFVVIIY